MAALEADERDPADLVLTDYSMPRMNGDELLVRLRERRPSVPAIVLTGYTGHEGLGGRLTVVLDKPIRLSRLAGQIAALLVVAHDGDGQRS